MRRRSRGARIRDSRSIAPALARWPLARNLSAAAELTATAAASPSAAAELTATASADGGLRGPGLVGSTGSDSGASVGDDPPSVGDTCGPGGDVGGCVGISISVGDDSDAIGHRRADDDDHDLARCLRKCTKRARGCAEMGLGDACGRCHWGLRWNHAR